MCVCDGRRVCGGGCMCVMGEGCVCDGRRVSGCVGVCGCMMGEGCVCVCVCACVHMRQKKGERHPKSIY